MKNWFLSTWKENKAFILFMALMFVFRSAVADWNEVPTGSMQPTIVEGDRLFVNKMAYDIRVPFTHLSLLKLSDPARGDIIVFDSKASDKRLVKRVVGIPGDSVELSNNILKINGEQLVYETVASEAVTFEAVTFESTDASLADVDLRENLLGVEHLIRVKKAGSRLSSFRAVTVPAGYYLALGDNRDNSADSRVIGFVPRNEIVGRSKSVVMSLNYDNFYLPRGDRFFHAL